MNAQWRALQAFARWGDGCISTTEFRPIFEAGFPALEFSEDYDILDQRIKTALDVDR